MNSEIRQDFINIYCKMVCGDRRCYSNSMILDHLEDQRHTVTLRYSRYEIYGKILNQIRLEIETHGYFRSHQHELSIILRFLRAVNDSELSEILQKLIDSLGDP